MFRFTRHGFWELLIGALVLIGTVVALQAFVPGRFAWPISIPLVLILIWLFAFFRDPERPIPAEQHAMVSPADGLVSDITQLENCELLGGPAVRVGIFLSVFNVHVNRSPCDGRIIDIQYKHGKFVNAMKHAQASEDNESNTIVLAEPNGDRPIAVVKQIVGLIARRIVCSVKHGEAVRRGERIGMIKFGSRTELYIPQWLAPNVQVKVGQSVRGATDVIALLGNPIHTVKHGTGPNNAPLDEEFERTVPRETPA